MEFIEYITKQGERQDVISQNAFGSPFMFDVILRNNPGLPIVDTYEGGISLKVPVLGSQEVIFTDEINLPPWKR